MAEEQPQEPAVTDPDLEREFPSVSDAYAFVLASYDWSLRRFEALDARLRHIGMAAVTLAVGVPVVARALRGESGLDHGWLFVVGAVLGVLVAATALVSHTLKHLTLVSLEDLWTQNLHKSTWEFRKDQIKFAADRQKANGKIIEARGRLTIGLAVVFTIQVVVMATWVALNMIPPAQGLVSTCRL